MERLSSMFGAARRGGLSPLPCPALKAGSLHEVFADPADWAAALGFALAMAGRERRGALVVGSMRSPLKGLGVRGLALQGAGLAGLGIDPARLVLVAAETRRHLLHAALEAARCPGVAAVLLESWGRFAEYDLTASRRLVLAAERSGVSVTMLRGDAQPCPSAAQTRWRIASAASTPWLAKAPGLPAIEAELLRQRGGPAGMVWRLEWDDRHGTFRPDSASAAIETGAENRGETDNSTGGASLSGAVVPLALQRADTAHSRAA